MVSELEWYKAQGIQLPNKISTKIGNTRYVQAYTAELLRQNYEDRYHIANEEVMIKQLKNQELKP